MSMDEIAAGGISQPHELAHLSRSTFSEGILPPDPDWVRASAAAQAAREAAPGESTAAAECEGEGPAEGAAVVVQEDENPWVRVRAAQDRGADEFELASLRKLAQEWSADRDQRRQQERWASAPPDPERLFCAVLRRDEVEKAEYEAANVRQLRLARKNFDAMGFTTMVSDGYNDEEVNPERPCHLLVLGVLPEGWSANDRQRFLHAFCDGREATLSEIYSARAHQGSLLAAVREASDDNSYLVYFETPEEGARGLRYRSKIASTNKASFVLPPKLRLGPDATAEDIARVLASKVSIPTILERYRSLGNNASNTAASFLEDAPLSEDEAGECIVEGLLLAGCVTLLVGDGKSGKTTLGMHLGQAIAAGAVDFLGLPIVPEHRGKTVAYLFGEDRPQHVQHRLARLRAAIPPAAGRPLLRLCKFRDEDKLAGLKDELDQLETIENLGMVYVDPALDWFITAGVKDENDGPQINAAFAMLRAFAEKTGCAVVLTHHTGGKSLCRSDEEVIARVRGSTVFIQRPRCVLTMRRERSGAVSVLAVKRSNLERLVPPRSWRLALEAERETFSVLEDGAQDISRDARGGVARANLTAPRVFAEAVGRLLAAGEGPVFRTGKRSVWSWARRRPSLDLGVGGMSRVECDKGTAAAIQAGLLTESPDGLRPSTALSGTVPTSADPPRPR